MFQFYRDCIYEYVIAPTWVTPAAQTVTALVAAFALWIAWKNLRGIKNTQSLQAQTSLINLENKVRKNLANLKLADHKWTKEGKDKKDIELFNLLTVEKINAFELYVSSADRLAALINSEYLTDQFKNRNWEDEYYDIFTTVTVYHENEDTIISGKDRMVDNIKFLLNKWK